jgi:general secretion pathway protein N
MKVIFGFLFILVMAAAAVPMIPLQLAVEAMHLDKIGLTQSGVDGNLWAGHIYGVQLGKISFGDVSTKMSLDDISKGRIKLELEGSDQLIQPKGAFSYGLGGAGVEKLSMAIPAVGGAPMLPPATLVLDELTAFFPGGECADVTGGAHIYLSGSTAGSGLPNGMSGPALCRDGHLTFDMASESGNEQQQVSILSSKSYSVRAVIKQAPFVLAGRLRNAGFVQTSEGYVYQTEKTL